MQQHNTLSSQDHSRMQAMAADSLVGRLNNVIRDFYPVGQVSYPEVIQALVSLAVSYRRGLHLIETGQSPHAEPEVSDR